MFLTFLDALRRAGIPAGPKEHLVLLDALAAGVIERRVEDFYYLARATYVKDEGLIDRFDQVFAATFHGAIATPNGDMAADIPADWLAALAERYLSDEERAAVQALGSWDEIMATLRQRLAEQTERHSGGGKWIGTGGTSPFGHGGYNPAGVRIGGEGKQGRAVKVWERREFRNLDSTRELGTRTIKVALRRLRRFAREGAADELDMAGTIDGTARAGWLDVRMRPERRNAVKLLLFLDVGGSMDPWATLCADLFSAATAEFRHLEFFYFHNCIYEGVWKDNRRRFAERTPTSDILHRYGRDYKMVVVGDASMSPYEISQAHGSVEHDNDESGAAWLRRLVAAWPASVWLNPVPPEHWGYTPSIGMIRQLIDDRMFPLTLAGLDEAMALLTRRRG